MRCITPLSSALLFEKIRKKSRLTPGSLTAVVALAFLCPAEAASVVALPAIVISQTAPKRPVSPATPNRRSRTPARTRQRPATNRAAQLKRGTANTAAKSAAARQAAIKKAAAANAARTTSPTKTPAADPPKTEAKPAQKQGFVRGIVRFIIEKKFWIIGALGTGLALSLGFLFLSSRRPRGEAYDEENVEMLPLRTSSAHGEDDEDEGPRRVLVDRSTGRPKTMPTRDESEYALVVDEDELQLPVHDGSASGEFERSVLKVQGMVEQSDFEGAYDVYSERLKDHELHAFHAGLERRLGKYFLKNKNYRRAAQILEHHVSTQPQTEIEPDVYFDLGYAFYKQKTLEKSRKFFRVFAERERNPAYSDRARRLVERLEKLENLN